MKLIQFILTAGILNWCLQVNAQYENVWAFGRNAGIDFNKNSPTAISTKIYTIEGSAVVCNKEGQLLFYTDGTSLWNQNHEYMPNGKDLPGLARNITASTSQGTLIVPIPGRSEQYYIFSLGCHECPNSLEVIPGTYAGRLYYSIVDMSLNGGLGDVVSQQKGILLDSFLTEHLISVSGNNCDMWILTVSQTDNAFKVFRIDINGINSTPIYSPGLVMRANNTYPQFAGTIDVSPDRSKIALARDKLLLYHFDPDQGTISNPIVLDDIIPSSGPQYSELNLYYGVAFSEDNSKIYASILREVIPIPSLLQFDLSSEDSMQIIRSRYVVDSTNRHYAIRRGPDQKIYVVDGISTRLSVIHNPNNTGAACNFKRQSFNLYPNSSACGLPNVANILTNRHFYTQSSLKIDCVDSQLAAAKQQTGVNYVWEDGSTGPNRYLRKQGIYWVHYQSSNSTCTAFYTDTFKVQGPNIDSFFTREYKTAICLEDTITLNARHQDYSDYLWSDSIIGSHRTITKSGVFRLQYENKSKCELYEEEYVVTFPSTKPQHSFQVDTLICIGETVDFVNTSSPIFTQYQWNFNDHTGDSIRNPSHTFMDTGSYEVRLISHVHGKCYDTTTRIVVVDPILPVSFQLNPDSICVGQSIKLKHQLVGPSVSMLTWSIPGILKMNSESPSLEQAIEYPGKHIITLEATFRACPASQLSDSIFVEPLPAVSLGNDSTLCFDGQSITLKNAALHRPGRYRYLWNTGDTSVDLKVIKPGNYKLTLTHSTLYCSTTESITIAKNCYLDVPNAFTPNGDGINDYFLPRQLLSNGINSFRMQVFNRWGQVVFENETNEGRGWDGRFNSVTQPVGVYIYKIELTMNNGYQEQYHGNVTLIR